MLKDNPYKTLYISAVCPCANPVISSGSLLEILWRVISYHVEYANDIPSLEE